MAQKLHPTCIMWSCSFLPSLRYTMYLNGSYRQPEALCCYCNEPLDRSADGKVNGVFLKDHMVQHNFRACNQTLYFSGQEFRQHLQDSHRSSHDSTLFAGWTLLLKSTRKELPSVFEQIERIFIGRSSIASRGLLADESKVKKGKKHINDRTESHGVHPVPTSFMELTDTPQRPEPKKLRRKQSSVAISKQSEEEPHSSLQLIARSPATDCAIDTVFPRAPSRPTLEKCTTLQTASGAPTCPVFYRKKFDASMRNRIYMAADDEVVDVDSVEQQKD